MIVINDQFKIIQCKNCIHNGRIDTDCPLRGWILKDDDFCSYGELEEDNIDNSEYVEIYDKLSDNVKLCMHDLYMKGIDRDGHVWVTYSEIQDMIIKLMNEGELVNTNLK